MFRGKDVVGRGTLPVDGPPVITRMAVVVAEPIFGDFCPDLGGDGCTPTCGVVSAERTFRGGSNSLGPGHRVRFLVRTTAQIVDPHHGLCNGPLGGVNPRGPLRVYLLLVPKGDARSIESERLKSAFISALAAGKTIEEGLAIVRRTRGWYQNQRTNDLMFRAKADQAKTRGHAARLEQEQARGTMAVSGLGTQQSFPTGFSGFVEHFFKMEHQAHQLRMVEELNSVEPREIVMFLLWPESGKTTTLENWICRRLALMSDHRITVISESGDHGKKMISRVKNRFTDETLYPEFLAAFGPFYEEGQEREGRLWQSDKITIAKRSGDERDPSLRASAWHSSNYGVRIDTLLVDDVQSRRNMTQAAEILGTLRQTFWSRGKQMRTFIVGNRVGTGDVYEQIIDAGLLTRDPIILPAAGAMGADPGAPTIPESWWTERTHTGKGCCPPQKMADCPKDGSVLTPTQFLDLIRHQVGEEAWWSSYMQNPVAEALSTFGHALNQCLDTTRLVGPLRTVA